MTDRRDLAWWLGVVVALAASVAALDLLHRRVLAGALTDLDAPWHLATGRLIVETGQVPRVDPFCFTSDGLDWVNLNWLAQWALYRAFLAWGMEGPMAIGSAAYVATLVLAAAGLRGRPLPRLLALAFVALSALMVRGIRPQVLTYVALAGLVLLLLPRRGHDDVDVDPPLGWRRLVVAAALLLVWDHLHGGFVWGWCLLAGDAAGAAISSWRRGGPPVARRSVELAALVAVGMLGFAVHPHGFAALEHALLYTRRLGPLQLQRIQKLQPLTFSSPVDWVAVAYFGLLLAGWVLGRERVRARDLVLGVGFALMTIAIRRSFVALVLVTAPCLVACSSHALDRLGTRARSLATIERVLAPTARLLPWVAAVGTALWVGLWVPLRRAHEVAPGDPTHPAFDRVLFPTDVAAWLATRGGDGRIFNDYGAGGLFAWALYPARRIFVDGRGDLHARGRGYSDYVSIVELAPGWRELLASYDIELAAVRGESRLAAALRQEGWTVVFEAQGMVVLAPPGS